MTQFKLQQTLLSEIPVGGKFVKPDWFDSRIKFVVKRHYVGFSYLIEKGKRVKDPDSCIPRTVTEHISHWDDVKDASGKIVERNPVKITRTWDNSGIYVMQQIPVENEPAPLV